MKTRLVLPLLVLLITPLGQAMACSACFGNQDPVQTKHMAVAIWFLMAAVLSVLGGFGAFSLHLWRHSKMPLAPHQELAQEDLEKYD